MKLPFSFCSLINRMDDLSDSAPVTEIGPILEFDPRLLAAAALSTRQVMSNVYCLLPVITGQNGQGLASGA